MDRPSSGQFFGDEIERVAALEGVIRTVSVHPQWFEAGVAKARSHSNDSRGLPPRGTTNPSSRSRPAEPGASGYLRGHVSIRRLQHSIRSIVLSPCGGGS